MRAPFPLDRFQIKKLVCEGSASTVYLATDLARSIPVLLKSAHPDSHGPAAVEKVRREFLLLSRIRHPHIIRVFDYGSCEELGSFFTMEDCGANTLALLSGTLSTEDLRMVLVQILRTLEFLSSN